jgi:hypothetical protein
LGRPDPRILVGIAVALVAGLVTWLIVRGGDEEPAPAAGGAQIVSEQELAGLSGSVGFPVFWAGRRERLRYELTSTPGGRVYVRYLPAGVQAGDSRADFLSVATYSVSKAYSALRSEGRKPGAETVRLPGDGIAMYNGARPTSVYVAYRSLPVQVEVFDPSGARALALVKRGEVRPVGATGAGAVPLPARIVTAPELRRLADSNSGPVYWAGPQAGRSYELSRTVDGRVYVRYLLPGVQAGDPRSRFLTVGTYPVRDGIATLRAAKGMKRLSLAGGALAAYNPSKATSVYYATPGSPAQVEVYSPISGRALELVAGGRVVPVR